MPQKTTAGGLHLVYWVKSCQIRFDWQLAEEDLKMFSASKSKHKSEMLYEIKTWPFNFAQIMTKLLLLFNMAHAVVVQWTPRGSPQVEEQSLLTGALWPLVD